MESESDDVPACSISPDRSRFLLMLHQTPVPLEASSPQMPLDKLSYR